MSAVGSGVGISGVGVDDGIIGSVSAGVSVGFGVLVSGVQPTVPATILPSMLVTMAIRPMVPTFVAGFFVGVVSGFPVPTLMYSGIGIDITYSTTDGGECQKRPTEWV